MMNFGLNHLEKGQARNNVGIVKPLPCPVSKRKYIELNRYAIGLAVWRDAVFQ